MTKNNLAEMPERTPYDAELGRINATDKEYAADLLEDLLEGHPTDTEFRLGVVAAWLRKSRYEAVIADRALRESK